MVTATGFSGALSDANMPDVEHPPTADPSCENKDNDAPCQEDEKYFKSRQDAETMEEAINTSVLVQTSTFFNKNSCFYAGCAYSAAEDDRCCSNIYEVNTWLWCGKPPWVAGQSKRLQRGRILPAKH
jgi:hypothetical protein